MEIFEEMREETKELLLDSLINRTLTGKQKWEGMDYNPICFLKGEENEEDSTFISQMFEMKTEFNGRIYSLELMERICLPSEKRDISGMLIYEGEEWGKYDLFLPFDENKSKNDARHLQESFTDSVLVRLLDLVVSLFAGSEAESMGFSYARYFNQKDIESKWKKILLVKLGEKLMGEKRMKDFHRIVLDTDYRKELLKEVK